MPEKIVHPHYTAAKMAASEMKDLMGFIGDSEFGAYPGAVKSSRVKHTDDVLAEAPDDVKMLLDNGFPRYFVERLANLVRED